MEYLEFKILEPDSEYIAKIKNKEIKVIDLTNKANSFTGEE